MTPIFNPIMILVYILISFFIISFILFIIHVIKKVNEEEKMEEEKIKEEIDFLYIDPYSNTLIKHKVKNDEWTYTILIKDLVQFYNGRNSDKINVQHTNQSRTMFNIGLQYGQHLKKLFDRCKKSYYGKQ